MSDVSVILDDMQMILIRTDGTVEAIEPTKGLTEMQRALEVSYVDVIRIEGFDIWIDDEGAINGSAPNPVATLLLSDSFPRDIVNTILGNALVANHNEEGDTIGLSDELTQVMLNLLRQFQTQALDRGLI